MPIHGNAHWSLAVVDPTEGKISHYDSNVHMGHEKLVEALASAFRNLGCEMECDKQDCYQEGRRDKNECGTFFLKNVLRAIRPGFTHFKSSFNTEWTRKFVLKLIQNGKNYLDHDYYFLNIFLTP